MLPEYDTRTPPVENANVAILARAPSKVASNVKAPPRGEVPRFRLLAAVLTEILPPASISKRFEKVKDEYSPSCEGLVSAVGHFLCIILGIVMVADEWDYDITAFVASLGIGAIAIALAAKDSLANIFGSIVIITERPFVKGDWISANNVEGIVELISFRSTCVRTFYQELVFIPNSLLSNTPIINYTRRQKYRIQFLLGLTYSTTREQMENVCLQIRQLCETMDEIHNDGIDVNFFEFGDSSLNIRIVCYAKADNNSVYLRVREKFNLAIMKIVEDNGVSCAFPSRSIYFETPIPQADKEK